MHTHTTTHNIMRRGASPSSSHLGHHPYLNRSFVPTAGAAGADEAAKGGDELGKPNEEERDHPSERRELPVTEAGCVECLSVFTHRGGRVGVRRKGQGEGGGAMCGVWGGEGAVGKEEAGLKVGFSSKMTIRPYHPLCAPCTHTHTHTHTHAHLCAGEMNLSSNADMAADTLEPFVLFVHV